jgi:hypothetical protein
MALTAYGLSVFRCDSKRTKRRGICHYFGGWESGNSLTSGTGRTSEARRGIGEQVHFGLMPKVFHCDSRRAPVAATGV